MRTLLNARNRPCTRLPALTLAFAGAALLSACGGTGTTTAAPVAGGTNSGAPTVEIERSRYAPQDLTIEAGATVDFVNLDPFDHTVTAAADSTDPFDSGSLGQDETFSQTFERAGTYRYFCEIHPTMRATITVG